MGYQHNSSLEHETKIDGVSIVESWIVKDPANDTANAYGLNKEDIKEGSWIVKMKCDNKDIYSKALNGEINGFSIDALLSLELINTETKMSKLDKLFLELKELIAPTTETPTEIKFGMAKLKDGVDFMFEGDELVKGAAVWVESEAEEGAEPVKEVLPDGEYSLEDGKMMVVVEGVVDSIADAPTEETPAEDEEIDLVALEEMLKQMIDLSKHTTSQINDLKVEFTSQVEVLKTENISLKAEVLKLGEQPAAEPKKRVEQKTNQKLSLTERLSNLKNK